MKEKSVDKYRHLTLSDRIAVEQGLNNGHSFKKIALRIKKDPTTVSKEVRRAVRQKEYSDVETDCAYFEKCRTIDLCKTMCFNRCRMCTTVDCTKICEKWECGICEKLLKAPYVCNACRIRAKCKKKKLIYRASRAHRQYVARLSDSRKGINVTVDEIHELNDLLSPLIANQQPISHIYATHADEIGISRKTLYNYVDAGVFTFKNIDLLRKVKYKRRKKKSHPHSKDYSCRRNRTYEDFEKYIRNHSEIDVIEMDTVKGTRERGKCLLTMMFRSSRLMLIFLLNNCETEEVVRIFDELTDLLGEALFEKAFPVILTDNGPEFKNVDRMECTRDGVMRTKIFYCDPQKSNQKSRLERNHEYIRMIIPKGRSMHNLDEKKVLLMCNHINSTARDSLNNHTPYEAAELLLNKKVMDVLDLQAIPHDSVVLHPSLLKK